jgi:hypothetical protein
VRPEVAAQIEERDPVEPIGHQHQRVAGDGERGGGSGLAGTATGAYEGALKAAAAVEDLHEGSH